MMIRANPIISSTALTTAPAYMSLIAVCTGAGGAGRRGPPGWPVDGQDWSSDPFVAQVREGKLYGRGACDMKGFVGTALALAPEFAAATARICGSAGRALLGDSKVNIATFHLGRDKPGGEAIALVSVDSAISPDLLTRIAALEGVTQAKPLSF